ETVRKTNRGDDAATWTLGNVQSGGVAIERPQSLADIRQADARRRVARLGEPGAVVADADDEGSVLALCRDLERAGVAALRDAVAQRVLDERLQDELRHERGA